MSLLKRGNVWWYEFRFAGRRVRESSKTSSKTLAKAAEQRRRRELEEGFNNLEDVRHERVRTIREVGDDYLTSYRLRHPRSATFVSRPSEKFRFEPSRKFLLTAVKGWRDGTNRDEPRGTR